MCRLILQNSPGGADQQKNQCHKQNCLAQFTYEILSKEQLHVKTCCR